MVESHSLTAEQLMFFLDRHRKNEAEIQDFDFHAALKRVLDELQELAPSENMFVLLDDPVQVENEGETKNLVYVAGIGERATQLLGLKTVSIQGMISQTYRTGTIQTAKPGENSVLDKIHLPKEVKNAICSPLKIGHVTIGVLALYNKLDPVGFTTKDARLINMLSGYLSMALQTAVDTKKNKELTKRDNLTGLYNDRYFHTQLEREVFSAERNKSNLALLFLDLDNFKSINDKHGHLVGSQTLKQIGFVLREVVHVPNATLARYGGDEYVCILPGVSLEEAEKIANQIREKIFDKMFMIDRGHDDGSFISFKSLVTVSIGISSLHDHTFLSDDTRHRKNALVRMADQAMYDAKDKGKNCVSICRIKA